jgi:hypothetical protein
MPLSFQQCPFLWAHRKNLTFETMKQLEINQKPYKVPESWGDVTLGQFCEAFEPETETKRDRVIFGLKLSGIDYKEFCKWPFVDQMEVVNKIAFTWEDLPKAGDSMKIQHDGKTYAVPGNWGRVSVAEWLDLDFRITQLGTVKAIPYVLGIYFRLEGQTDYNSEQAAKLGEEFKGLPIVAAWSAANFFIRKGAALSKASKACLNLEAAAAKAVEQAKASLRNGGGSGKLRRWLGMMLLNSMKY